MLFLLPLAICTNFVVGYRQSEKFLENYRRKTQKGGGFVTNLQQRTAGGVDYELTRRRVKNINLRIRPNGTVAVSAPLHTPLAVVDDFVAGRAGWIEKAKAETLRRAQQAAQQPLPDAAEALAAFEQMSELVFPLFAGVLGGQKPVLKVRSMKSRWGVCRPAQRTITLALQLYNQPKAAQIYVVVHEYCHFLVPNHSPAFWAEVEKILPDWKARRRLLRQ